MSDSNPPSGTSTPRFASSGHTAEDLLKEQTVGLVHLSDFRKRRAEALEQSGGSGASTPTGNDSREQTPKTVGFKKRKKVVKRVGLSFGDDEEEDDGGSKQQDQKVKAKSKAETQNEDGDGSEEAMPILKKRLKPNSSVAVQPKAQTKSSLAKEASLKESLRKQYLAMNEAVRNTEFILPFAFFEAKEVSGGKVRLKKGDFVWLFLERARKIGVELAETGEGPAGVGGRRREWARIGVDDLMVVVGDMMIPHHLDFHTLILNKCTGYNGVLFPFSSEPTAATPAHLIPNADGSMPAVEQAEPASGLLAADQLKEEQRALIPDEDLEGFDRDPSLLRVVDRRWYEKNKHIYPMSVWEDFDPAKDYSDGGKKDREGNAFFFSSR
ncbi:hypothetical protein Q7P37_007100 [Cladosporium fusiforme]